MAAEHKTEFDCMVDERLTDLEKLTAAKHVAATIETPGWRLIVQLLEDGKARKLDGLVRHSERVRSQAEYAAALAGVRGYDYAVLASQSVLHVAELAAKRLSEAEGG